MKFRVLAVDYDGTIAADGRIDPQIKAALERARAVEVKLILVTGRMLSDLRRLLDLALFDAVVAENGAVLAFPAAGRSSALVGPPPAAFIAALAGSGLDPGVGMCVVELPATAAHAVLDAIRSLELPLACHFNRDRLMVLPQAVSKGTGLREALRALRLSPHNTIAIGDAENDHELLAACEIGAAVGWGSRALRDAADVVLAADGPRAVAAYVDDLIGRNRIVLPPRARRQLLLGRDAAGEVVSLAVRGRNVLVAGDPGSGKSWVAGLLCEQLLLQHYCVCVIDPEGDYAELESLPGVMVLGGDEQPPSIHDIARLLRQGEVSLVLDLSRMPFDGKSDYVHAVLQLITRVRRETGLPHRIVLDEAHYFLKDAAAAGALDQELGGHTLITYRVSQLHADVVAAAECIIVTRETDPLEAKLLYEKYGGSGGTAPWTDALAGLGMDEAALLPVGEEAAGKLRRVRIAPRLTHHVRHRHKYLDVPVGDRVAFRFEPDSGKPGTTVSSLQQLVDALNGMAADGIVGHIRRGDLSRWIGDVFRDGALARQIGELEERFRLGMLPDFNGAVIHAIHARYHVVDDFVKTGSHLPAHRR